MSSNLPPGVSVSMIPGNRPEDIGYEEAWDQLLKTYQKNKLGIPEEFVDEDWFVNAVDIAMEFAYNKGYRDAVNDAEFAQQHGYEGAD